MTNENTNVIMTIIKVLIFINRSSNISISINPIVKIGSKKALCFSFSILVMILLSSFDKSLVFNFIDIDKTLSTFAYFYLKCIDSFVYCSYFPFYNHQSLFLHHFQFV